MPIPFKPAVKSRMKMKLEKRRQAMLQLHLTDQQIYCPLSCVLLEIWWYFFYLIFSLITDVILMAYCKIANKLDTSVALSYCHMKLDLNGLCTGHPIWDYMVLSEIRAWISNHTHGFIWDIITLPSPNFNSSLTKPPSKLGHDWIIASHFLNGFNYVSIPDHNVGLAIYCQ